VGSRAAGGGGAWTNAPLLFPYPETFQLCFGVHFVFFLDVEMCI
jgi:hypothetical protein